MTEIAITVFAGSFLVSSLLVNIQFSNRVNALGKVDSGNVFPYLFKQMALVLILGVVIDISTHVYGIATIILCLFGLFVVIITVERKRKDLRVDNHDGDIGGIRMRENSNSDKSNSDLTK